MTQDKRDYINIEFVTETCPSCLFSGLILSIGTQPLLTKILCLEKSGKIGMSQNLPLQNYTVHKIKLQ